MATKTARRSCCCGGKTACECPECTGLECLERPRFFAGQLLTEKELGSAQDYVRAKNRLHNLHLHGWGVVCGLEVVCHECEGWVTVSPGYAIDPCGEDIIVCQEHPLNVIEMIRRCKEARRRRRRADCDPIRGRNDPDCQDREEHWCITLRYAEQEGRPTTALRREACDRCGCGPGCRCGCPCHGEEAGGKDRCCGGERPSGVRSGVGRTVSACEPTRILETYCLEICEAPEDYCEGFESEAEKAWKAKFAACFEGLKKTFSRAPKTAIGVLGGVQLRQLDIDSNLGVAQDQLSPAILHDSYCQVYDFLYELFRRNPGNAHCALLHRLEELDCPPIRDGDTVGRYSTAIQKPSQQLLGYLLVYLLDCLCWAVQPPCAPCCPGEDELILACLTVRDDEIEHICNFSCRRYAGAFPPTIAGIHLGPLMPIFGKLFELLCCNDVLEKLFRQLLFSTGSRQIAQLLAEDDFSRPLYAYDQARKLSFDDVFGAPAGERVNLTTLVDRPVAEVETAAAERGVELTVREVDSLPRLAFLRALPAAGRGDRLVAFAREGKVLGFARPESTEATLVAQNEELRAVKGELEALRKKVDRSPPGGRTATARKKS